MTADLAHTLEEPNQTELGWRNVANLATWVIMTVLWFSGSSGLLGQSNRDANWKYTPLLGHRGVIFAFEGIFAVRQMMPRFRNPRLVHHMTPGWLVTCLLQGTWCVTFAVGSAILSEVLIAGTVLGLLSIVVITDSLAMTWCEYLMFRGGFSLHIGWVMNATAAGVIFAADSHQASKQMLLGMALASAGAICVSTTIFALVKGSPDPIVCCVVAYAFWSIGTELGSPSIPNLWENPRTWDPDTLGGLQLGAQFLMFLALTLAVVAIARAVFEMQQKAPGDNLAGTEIL